MTSLLEFLAALPESQELPPLVTVESGATFSLDRSGRWIHRSAEGVTTFFTEATAPAFCEALETPRDDFEQALEGGARAAGLPEVEVVDSFPVQELVRGILSRRFPYMTRLALLWLRPSELRPLRADIDAVTKTPQTPQTLKDLARRLTVPEG